MATQTNQKQLIAPSKGEIILYQTADGRTSIDVKLDNETVWLSSEQMALLFERDRTVIQRHIRNIYNEGELTRDTTCAKFAHMGRDGDQTYVTELFNLDVIISVGYRVKSQRGTQFRIWANSVLKDYLIKGYAVKNDLVQQKYDDLKALVDVMGRTMGYLNLFAFPRGNRNYVFRASGEHARSWALDDIQSLAHRPSIPHRQDAPLSCVDLPDQYFLPITLTCQVRPSSKLFLSWSVSR